MNRTVLKKKLFLIKMSVTKVVNEAFDIGPYIESGYAQHYRRLVHPALSLAHTFIIIAAFLTVKHRPMLVNHRVIIGGIIIYKRAGCLMSWSCDRPMNCEIRLQSVSENDPSNVISCFVQTLRVVASR
jgi:hypothetical protein